MSTWRDAIRSELAAYRRETGEDIVSLERFYDRSLDTLGEQFPENNHPEAQVRQCLQELRDRDEVTFLGDGEYRIEELASDGSGVPTVWIENTTGERQGDRHDETFALGNAIYTPTQVTSGADTTTALDEPEVGDIVLHLLQEQGVIVGVSRIDTESDQDQERVAETGDDDEVVDHRKLADYTELDDPIAIVDDILANESYRSYLEWIREKYENVVFEEDLTVAADEYFTRCPPELLQVFITESADLAEKLQAREYPIEQLPHRSLEPMPDYDTVTGATDDIRKRLAQTPERSNWLADQISETIVRDWTVALSGLGPESTVSQTTLVKLEQIAQVYHDGEQRLATQAEELQSGTLYTLTPSQTLFVVLLRELQSELGLQTNANHVKVQTILDERYTVERYPLPQSSTDDSEETLDPATLQHPDHPLVQHVRAGDVTTYKYTDTPEYWLSVFEYSALVFGEEAVEREQWESIEPGDVILFHSTETPATEGINEATETVVGAAVAGQKTKKTEPWTLDEHESDTVHPHVLAFERLFASGDLTAVDHRESVPDKSKSQLEAEIAALVETTVPTEPADDQILLDYLAGHLKEVPPVALHKSFTGEIPTAALDGLHFPEQGVATITEQIQAALRSGKHIIFTGPPGTGKTEVARQVSEYLAAEYPYLYSGAQTTTATADWSTFDTVGGYMPEAEATDDHEQLTFSPGVILNRFKNHRTAAQRNETVVIDEINRADIDKSFGQLFTTLSGQSVSLPYQRNNQEIEVHTAGAFKGLPAAHQYVVPASWRIFATMNTFDKTSLYEMSYAFMRRFAFIRIDVPTVPAADDARHDLVGGYMEVWPEIDVSDAEQTAVGELWRAVNTVEGGRTLGPALVKDILRYLSEHSTQSLKLRLTQAVISYVFPQLEGLPKRQQVLTSISKHRYIDRTEIDRAGQEMLQTDPLD